MRSQTRFALVFLAACLLAACGDDAGNAVCGDGHLDPGEQCDDGNTAAADGCDSTCHTEIASCGNGSVDTGEQCDDGNTTAGDGCGSSCQNENLCGNGSVDTGEQCDDGNSASGDGCSGVCSKENGYSCVGAPSACTSICGDSKVAVGAEGCDDGNGSNGDGCGDNCTTETGYHCTGSPSTCATVCGDGVAAPGIEACDDGNTVDGDGCSVTCHTEDGYTCTGAPSVCASTCGDGRLAVGAEMCDDGNTVDGDCCSASCGPVMGCETESNNDQASADEVATHFIDNKVKGNISGGGEFDYYVLTLPAGNDYDLHVTTLDGYAGTTCAGNHLDSEVDVLDATGTSLGSNDDISSSNHCSNLRVLVGAGTYFIRVRAHLASARFDYTLQVVADPIVCGDGTVAGHETCDDGDLDPGDGCDAMCALEGFKESEPNDTRGQANGPVPAQQLVLAAITPGSDIDFFSFVVSAVSDVTIESFDAYGPATCAGVNTVMQLLAPDGTLLIEDDDDGVDACAKINPVTDAGARHLLPGTYFVRVTDKGQDTVIPAYTVAISFTAVCGDGNVTGSEECDGTPGCDAGCQRIPSCGDGFIDAPEQCDDGNAAAGDGCSDSCQLEHRCGNGMVEITESCDDGNTAAGDGCDASCQYETVTEIEPNDSAVDATVNGFFPTQGRIVGAIGSSGDKDYYRFTLPVAADVDIETFDGSGGNTCATINTKARLYAANGTTELASDDNDGVGDCAKITAMTDSGARHLAAGKYFVEVEHQSNNAVISSYQLAIRLAICGDGVVGGSEECDGGAGCDATCQRIPVCGDGFIDTPEQCDDSNNVPGDGCEPTTCTFTMTPYGETEPNNSSAQASPAGPGLVTAAITPAGDKDFFSFTITRTQSVKLETFDSTAVGHCTGIDTIIHLYGTDGTTQLALNDDVGGGFNCSRIDQLNLAPGTYFVSVEDYQNNDAINYQLLLTYH